MKLAGGVPVEVFAGADRGFEPSIEAIEAARTERTKAIIVNTPMGLRAMMNAITRSMTA